jgi:sulfite exporter TauE/SafE
MSTDLFSAFVIGLLSAGHCLGMCGGITSMLTSAIPIQNNKPQASKALLVFCYNFGRIFSYAFIGAIVGFTGSIAAKSMGVPLAGLRLVAGIFLVLLGLYLGQWLMLLNRIEAVGKHLWKFISPLSKKVIPVDTPTKALSLGLIWGWLPCGLVYSTLTWSLASGSIFSGAAIMAAFGVGTLPALLTMSFGVLSVKKLLTNPFFRKILAFSIILYGFFSIYVAYQLMF